MKFKSSKVWYSERCLLFSKTTVKRNMITVFSSRLCKYRVRYSSYESASFTVLLQNIFKLKFSQCRMIPWFFWGIAYQTMKSRLNDMSASPEQTDSFALIKKKNVTSTINQPETNNTNKIKRLITSTPYTTNTQIFSSGTV